VLFTTVANHFSQVVAAQFFCKPVYSPLPAEV